MHTVTCHIYILKTMPIFIGKLYLAVSKNHVTLTNNTYIVIKLYRGGYYE